MKVTAQTVSCLDFTKYQGLLPVTVQHLHTGQVLMQAYMNEAAVRETIRTGQVTFFSRSKKRLWTKGESSGHFLNLKAIYTDCDQDAILIHALPAGPTCHLGTRSCFDSAPLPTISELAMLEETIQERHQSLKDGQDGESYTASLLAKGIHKCAQKTGEEGVEVALAAVNENDTALLNESADLIYHLLVTLRSRELELSQVIDILRQRRRAG